MAEPQDSSPSRDDRPERRRREPDSFVTLLNAAAVGLGGLYVSTGSIAIVVLAAALVFLLCLINSARGR
ncbi:hypothetical protein JNUCC0626_24290 [Lentzea sp. JNUCC 0626]|uniref:hypothetical protein n=1 Tax=Lentzea sp. JNUCC 0626 TaxID=3367513 RepID=UPI003748C83D